MALPDTTPLSVIIDNLTRNWNSLPGFEDARLWDKPQVNYYLGTTATAVGSAPESTGYMPLGAVQQARAADAFAIWNELIDGITLVPVATEAAADITFAYSTTTANGGSYTTPTLGSRIKTLDKTVAITDQAIWLSSGWMSLTAPFLDYGALGFETYLHEIGHALGLSHPGPYNANDTPPPDHATDSQFPRDSRQYTIMSYFGGIDTTFRDWLLPSDPLFDTPIAGPSAATPMLYDIAAIQAKYGADYTTRDGNTTYGFNASGAGWDFFDFTTNTRPIFTIWDGGGLDTLDASDTSEDQIIDLAPGAYSSLLGLTENVAIALNPGIDPLRTLIENGIGGRGNDSIAGNRAANRLVGNAGNDSLDGRGINVVGDPADTLTGGAGLDSFTFGKGYGRTIVTDFEAGERLDLRGAGVHDFASLMAGATRVGSDLVLTIPTTASRPDVLVLEGFRRGAITPDMVQFGEDPDQPRGDFVILPNPSPTLGQPMRSGIARLGDGGFIVVEETLGTYATQALMAHRFDARGMETGPAFQINTTDFGTRFGIDMRIASIGKGNFIVVWGSNDNGGDIRSLRARIFDDRARPLGDDFVINTTQPESTATAGLSLFDQSIRVNDSGSVTVTWLADVVPGVASFQTHLFARNISATGGLGVEKDLGAPLGPPDQTFAKTYALSTGESLRVWLEQIPGGQSVNYHAFAQVVGAAGAAPVQLDSNGLIVPQQVSFAELADGRLAFGWNDGSIVGSQQTFRGAGTIILDADLKGFTRPGTAGADSLRGNTENDRLYGLDGNDSLAGGAGPDLLDGGDGTDLADYTGSLAAVEVSLSAIGPQQTGGHAEGDSLVSIEDLRGSAYADTLTGSAARNLIEGGFGNDLITGVSAAGQRGDTLPGGPGNDSIQGGAGNDLLIGGEGADRLEPGPGDDVLQFRRGEIAGDTLIGLEGLGVAGGDQLILRGYAAGARIEEIAPGRYAVMVGTQGFDQFAMAPGQVLVTGEDVVFL